MQRRAEKVLNYRYVKYYFLHNHAFDLVAIIWLQRRCEFSVNLMRGDSNVTQKQDLVLSTATQHFHQQKEISLHTFLLCDKQVAESRHHGVLHFLQDHYSYSTVHSQSRAGSFHDEKTDGPWIQEHRYTVNKQCLRPNVTLTVKGISSVGHTEDSTGLLSVGLSYLFPDRLHFLSGTSWDIAHARFVLRSHLTSDSIFMVFWKHHVPRRSYCDTASQTAQAAALGQCESSLSDVGSRD